ncbi:sigma-54 interaction domain-containing protein [Pelovirga terrestris]|uniref:Sigma 54-interacting transcriptional regulator n=1 Tax=Pelovirga terrestris TaxID=2771352 RepID=A0A8J6QM68_9BACT|nr:sigma 54-interacting transcriptional regulator [Pelovirga terrestris]MBD1401134.1 sigma 54-interacting transcriptional regulator [Pelovirga terrestris]
MMSLNDYLPVITPDLVLDQPVLGSWQVQAVSERLATSLGRPVDQLRGRKVAAVFPDAVPSLADLATEVVEQGQDLSGIRIQLVPRQADVLADLQVVGLTDDHQGRQVVVILRPLGDVPEAESFHRLVGVSAVMREVFRKVRLYAASDATVIITGETGAGKELVAHALHLESHRRNKPFAALNCTAISEQLLESELFGHERGAFTGAVRDHRGYFERADGGSLFLDELGDMPMSTQSKLLRVLEDGQVVRVGSEVPRKVDVRVIGATNVALEKAVANKEFRADLYHRLAVLRIHLPPLRERAEDIPLLAERFLAQFSHQYGKPARRLTFEAVRLLQSYLWPGNVRELRNVIERVVVESETEAIGARAFAEWIRERRQFAADLPVARPAPSSASPLPVALPWSGWVDTPPHASVVPGARGQKKELSEEVIRRAYAAADGNLSAAARRLGIHRATLYRHLQRLGLKRGELYLD